MFHPPNWFLFSCLHNSSRRFFAPFLLFSNLLFEERRSLRNERILFEVKLSEDVKQNLVSKSIQGRRLIKKIRLWSIRIRLNYDNKVHRMSSTNLTRKSEWTARMLWTFLRSHFTCSTFGVWHNVSGFRMKTRFCRLSELVTFFFALQLCLRNSLDRKRNDVKWLSTFFFVFELLGKFFSEKNRCAEIKTKILTLWAVEAFQLDRVIPAFHRIHPAEHRRSIPDLFRAGKRFLGRSVRQLVGSLVGRWFIHVDVERMHFILSANAHQLANPPTRLFRHQLIADFIR